MDLAKMFLLGLGGSAHCIGMCGGFAMTIGAVRPKLGPALLTQGVYSAGRLFTYGFLGALAGIVGGALARANVPLVGGQQVLAFIAGVVMLYIGLSSLGVLKSKWLQGKGGGLLAPLLRQFMNARGLGPFLLAGVFTGFLPCGLVYAALAEAATRADPMRAWLAMICFGAGTVPAMVAIGCGSTMMSMKMRARILKLAACFVIFLGCATLYRAFQGRNCCEEAEFRDRAADIATTAERQLALGNAEYQLDTGIAELRVGMDATTWHTFNHGCAPWEHCGHELPSVPHPTAPSGLKGGTPAEHQLDTGIADLQLGKG